jgi:hypothetical protein
MRFQSPSRAGRRTRRAAIAVALATIVPAMSACSALSGNNSSPPATQPAGTAGTGGSTSAAATGTPASSTEPSIVAATSGGGLVRLNPATKAVTQTLVPNGTGVEGDEVSVSSTGMVYYAVGSGACDSTIYSIPDGGGTPTPIVSGRLPAVSPDGSKLAYAVEPGMASECSGWGTSYPGTAFKVDIRTVSGGATVSIPEIPTTQQGLPAPVTHLSWASDNVHLAVSTQPAQDNEGWALDILDTTSAQTYEPGAGVTTVPVTGASPNGMSFYSEGVFLPNGNLFVVHRCCQGIQGKNDAPLLLEIGPDGALVHQVAIGFATTSHDSLDASRDGNWLLYLGGGDLYVSQGGARPKQIANGLVAATWA